MKTSYYKKFSMLTEEEKSKYIPVAISLTIPHWFDGCNVHMTELAPPQEVFKKYKAKIITEQDFITEYIDSISHWVNLEGIIDYLYMLEEATNKEVVLLCYEKSDAFCHRHILRNFLNNRHHLNIEEL